jgi:hypothetical protein
MNKTNANIEKKIDEFAGNNNQKELLLKRNVDNMKNRRLYYKHNNKNK